MKLSLRVYEMEILDMHDILKSLQVELDKQKFQFQQEIKQINTISNQFMSNVLKKSKIVISSPPTDNVHNEDYPVKTAQMSDLVTKDRESTDQEASTDLALTEVVHLTNDLFVVIETIGDGPYTIIYVSGDHYRPHRMRQRRTLDKN